MQLLLHLANNAAIIELKYIITSARNAAAIVKGMVELRSIVVYSRERERTLGPRRLRCSKLRRIGGLGDLMVASRRSSGCGACIPEMTTRRHRGRLLCIASRAKASTLRGRHTRFAGGSVFRTSFRGLLSLLATQQKKWNHYLQQQVVCVCVRFLPIHSGHQVRWTYQPDNK